MQLNIEAKLLHKADASVKQHLIRDKAVAAHVENKEEMLIFTPFESYQARL